MDDFYLKLVQMLKSGHTLVMATIISQEGSSPREVGTKCLIMDDGSLIGSVGGGILEARTVREARKVFKSGLPVRMSFSLDGSDAASADMICGGRSEIFLELISPDNPLHVSMFQEILNIKRPGEGGLLATVIDPEKWKNGAIQKVFIKQDSQIIGGLPAAGDYINALLNISANLPKSGEAKIFELHNQQS
ncbi:MAG TPA: XdhC family protein, partial [Desulfobacteraceae bacterium]|nr:XdhC family protein [Desulfobacteraceae bacterium]